jgi:hypothetical protein
MMQRETRTRVTGGVLLILLGLMFLAYQLIPTPFEWLQGADVWPLTVVAVGVFLLIFGLLVGAPGMAIPASIVSGIGLLLVWQNATGNWDSWSYAWALIPGFVGIGVILNGLLGGDRLRDALEGGFWLIVISLTLFAIFGSFLGGLNLFQPYLPVLLIVLGAVMLLRSLLRR